jgi:uncharacterized protein involved in exopolysaccharide biosynthesis
LTSATVAPADTQQQHIPEASYHTGPTADTTTTDSTGSDPWVLVRDLRRQIHELRQNNDQLQQQLNIKHQRLQQLESETNHQKGLMDKVARLEAELSVTKAELELTSLMAKEAQESNTLVPGLETPSR